MTTNEKPPITIFGAGIAGLTAAHELATRGFKVQILEPDFNAEHVATTNDRGIGGMARSQFAVSLNRSLGNARMLKLWPAHELLADVRLRFDEKGNTDEQRASDVIARFKEAIAKVRAAEGSPPPFAIWLHTPAPKASDATEKVTKDPRIEYLWSKLVDKGPASGAENEAALVEPSHPGLLTPEEFESMLLLKVGDSHDVSFVANGLTVAAEHGFRFFPSFYRHLFDTMKRTPITSPRSSERTKATTFDNLVPVEGLGFARGQKAVSFMIPRRKLSMEALRELLGQVLEQLDYTSSDIARFSLKLFKYMSSSTLRRKKEYETTSWGDFVDVDRYSRVSRQHIEYGPQMSAALRGSASDARTQGNITVQLLMDQLRDDSMADFTLAGPTSGAWFDHWHDFLDDQKVDFVRGSLTGFEIADDKIYPTTTPPLSPDFRDGAFIFALSLPAMVPFAEKFVARAEELKAQGKLSAENEERLLDYRRIGKFIRNASSLETALPDAPLQHLSGIQFYFDQDLRFWRGHTQYLDSEWGLTSIAQPQFWNRTRTGRDQYRSILSVDIGIFDREYRGKKAWQCSSEEIAKFTWEQIVGHHNDAFKKRYGPEAELPTPIAYALDGTLRFSTKRDGGIEKNGSPFLVNETSLYKDRPGGISESKRSKTVSLYDVFDRRFVIAGTFMKTFTRLTSMESANESARHAVNALLQVTKTPGDRCEIWDPEDHELDELVWLKELDERLVERQLPHIVDILGLDELPTHFEQFRIFATQYMRNQQHKPKET